MDAPLFNVTLEPVRQRTLRDHIVEIFWIYLRFIVLAVVIFFLVQWYIWKFEEGEKESSPTSAATTPNLQHSSVKQDL